MITDLVNRIKRLVIVALASDDELVEAIVLKGGNAIDIAYSESKSMSRTSYDLDFSIEDGDFSENEQLISERVYKTLNQTFLENDFVMIDYKFINRPKSVKEKVASFWGGYKVTFKVLQKERYDIIKDNVVNQRKAAIPIRPDQSPTFELEFSKFEYVSTKGEVKVDGYKIYVYTPQMIVFEKLRAICQQLPQYAEVISSHSSRPRARDFYDIHFLMDSFSIDVTSTESAQLIRNIFDAKRVPLEYIKEIKNHKSIHIDNWESVKDTVSQSEKLNGFDFYFSFVVNTFESITFP